MSNPCGGLTYSPYAGDICAHGYDTGVLMSENKLAAQTDANAILEATWDALLLADQPDRLYYINFNFNEFAENETVEEEEDNGTKRIIDVKIGTDTHKVYGSSTALKSIYREFRAGKTMYLWYTTSKGYIKGKEVTANTIEQIKVIITASYEKATKETSEKVVMYIQPQEDWKQFEKAIDPTDNFDVTGLTSVQNMTFTVVSCGQTSAVIDVKDLDGVAITTLTTGAGNFFTGYNTTDSATTTITNVTASGGRYTLSYASETVADVIQFGYDEPSTSSEFYDLITTVNGTVA